ncbi:flagellin [Aquisalinus flavus]|uniref:Flagellin n=1 Tax=Aquisalinus flavus TaxID=1526572 RepID=A0A8J2V2N1_9PROT|nr:flagellin [Aquisalinus flavus]MBD0425913.1 flagellin [Aquisalinus flavus]UNE48493.1 flagellin [Aquisalinus flavus]GGD12280.1 flagellin [Aquisalinus flavus]
MSSINFNQSSLVALDTLKGINKSLGNIQSQISTGKSVGSAKDNAAIWAISKVMESDVGGFAKINESLNLGSSSVAVARAGAEQIEGLLEDMKGLIISSQEEGQDQDKIQTDIDRLNEQMTSIVNAAQFNGVNLLKGGNEGLSVLSSLDRSSTGVSTSTISITRQDFTTNAQSVDTAGTYAAGTGTDTATLDATQSRTLTVGSPTAGVAYSIGLTGTDADSSAFVPADYTTAGSATGAANIAYVAKDGDTASDVAAGLAAAYATYAADNALDTDVLNVSASGADLTFTSGSTDGTDTIAVRLDTVTSDDNVAKGALSDVNAIDVTTAEGAAAALDTIETAIQASVNAAAEFGSAEKRIDNQMEFVGKLMDSMKAGISALTDTNMEEASARLQSLQVQQQLGVQALSIANGSSQTILSLFRG